MLLFYSQGIVQIPTQASNHQSDSNLSAGSHHSGESDEQVFPQVRLLRTVRKTVSLACLLQYPFDLQTPEKKTGNDRKRKRKTTSVDHNDNSGQGGGGQGASKSLKNDKKISEYFKVRALYKHTIQRRIAVVEGFADVCKSVVIVDARR